MSKNTIRAATGPWGSVKCEVQSGPSGYSVQTYINGVKQMPNYGLDKDEAFELADELVETRSGELIAAFEATQQTDAFDHQAKIDAACDEAFKQVMALNRRAA